MSQWHFFPRLIEFFLKFFVFWVFGFRNHLSNSIFFRFVEFFKPKGIETKYFPGIIIWFINTPNLVNKDNVDPN